MLIYSELVLLLVLFYYY